MLAVFGVTLSQTGKREDEFAINRCDLDNPVGICADIYSRGVGNDRAAVTSLIVGPLLLGAGAALLGVALRRKSASQGVAPVLGAGVAGVTWRQRF